MTARACLLAVAVACAVTAPAHAEQPTVWQRLAPEPADVVQQQYRALIQAGDDHLLVAMGSAQNTLLAWDNIKIGLGHYRKAIALAPDAAEAYYHLGSALSSIMHDCQLNNANPANKT